MHYSQSCLLKDSFIATHTNAIIERSVVSCCRHIIVNISQSNGFQQSVKFTRLYSVQLGSLLYSTQQNYSIGSRENLDIQTVIERKSGINTKLRITNGCKTFQLDVIFLNCNKQEILYSAEAVYQHIYATLVRTVLT